MKKLILVLCLLSISAALGQKNSPAEKSVQRKMTKHEAAVKLIIEKYFEAFNTHSLALNDKITTEDWYHINPAGDWKKGRAEVTEQLREVHSSFLKNVKLKLEDIDISFASHDVAVVTMTNSINIYILPNGEKHENERQIKTTVVQRDANG